MVINRIFSLRLQVAKRKGGLMRFIHEDLRIRVPPCLCVCARA